MLAAVFQLFVGPGCFGAMEGRMLAVEIRVEAPTDEAPGPSDLYVALPVARLVFVAIEGG